MGIDYLLRGLGRILPGWTPSIEQLAGYRKIALPVPRGAECRFHLHLYAGGGGSLSASLPGHDEREFFWFQEVETGHDTPEEEVFDSLLGMVKEIGRYPSRIRRKRGFLLWTFRCEVSRDGRWRSVAGIVACPRWSYRIPLSEGRVSEYRSPPLSEGLFDPGERAP
jgi:hypothetical protein